MFSEDAEEELADGNNRPVTDFGIQLNRDSSNAVKLAAKRLLNDDYLNVRATIGQNPLPDPRLDDIQILVTAGETWASLYGIWGGIDPNAAEPRNALIGAYQYFLNSERVAKQQVAFEKFYSSEPQNNNWRYVRKEIPIKKMTILAEAVLHDSCEVNKPQQASASWMQRSSTLDVAATFNKLANELHNQNILANNM